jgi:adenine/guanine phosphoribosyltransferase-like PRPP-binding protein
MSLDQRLALAAGENPVAVFVDDRQWWDELRSDLGAAAVHHGRAVDRIDPYAYQGRPTILRRLAGLLAGQLPEPIDRLVAADVASAPLTTAVALHTGLPFALAEPADPQPGPGRHHTDTPGPDTPGPDTPGTDPHGTDLHGEVHRGERVAVLAAVTGTGRRLLGTAERVRAQGAQIAAVITVIDRNEGAVARLREAGDPLRVLFHRGRTGLLTGPPAGSPHSAEQEKR